MKESMRGIAKPLLLTIILLAGVGSAYGVWSYMSTPPGWVDQSSDSLHSAPDYPKYLTAKGTATSPHKRMAEDKARLKAISNLMRSVSVTGNGITVINQETSRGKVIQKKFNGRMDDFKELDAYVEPVGNGEYRAHVLIGVRKKSQ
jgi:hypothetical protein